MKKILSLVAIVAVLALGVFFTSQRDAQAAKRVLPSVGDTVVFMLDSGPNVGKSRAAIITRLTDFHTADIGVVELPEDDPVGVGGLVIKTNVPQEETAPIPGTWRVNPKGAIVTGQ